MIVLQLKSPVKLTCQPYRRPIALYEHESLKGEQAGRRLAHVGSLLEGVGQTQELVLAPGTAREGDAERIVGRVLAVDSRDEASRHHDAGIARLGGDRGARAAGEQHGVELMLVHVGVHATRLGGEQVHGTRRFVLALTQIALGEVGGEEQVLAETQRLAGVRLVEGHDVGDGLDLVLVAHSFR